MVTFERGEQVLYAICLQILRYLLHFCHLPKKNFGASHGVGI